MEEPRRWREREGDEPELLRGARPSRRMTEHERARLARKASLIAAVPIGAGLLAGFKGTALAAMIGVGMGVAVIVGGPEISRWIDPSSSPPPRLPRAVATVSVPLHPVVSAPSAPPASASASALPEASSSAPSVPPTGPLRASPVPSANSLEQELAFLSRARTLLGSNPAGALAELDAMERAFPGGRLGIEREMLRVESLLAAGRSGDARARAEALLPRVQGLPYEDRLRGILEKNP